MPRAIVELSEHANRVVNLVKARDGLKGKSEAIDQIIEEYEEKILDPAFRPAFVREVQRIRKRRFKNVRSLEELPGDAP